MRQRIRIKCRVGFGLMDSRENENEKLVEYLRRFEETIDKDLLKLQKEGKKILDVKLTTDKNNISGLIIYSEDAE